MMTSVPLHSITAILRDAVIFADAEHRITLFNRGAEEIFGYRAEDVVGRPASMLMPERYRERHNRHLRRFAESEESSRMMGGRRGIVGLRKSGEEFPAEASISKVRTDGVLVFAVVLRDATERVETEEATREIERRWHRMADALPILFALVDAEGRHVFVNDAYADWIGSSSDDIVGRSLEEVASDSAMSIARPHMQAVLEGAPQRFATEAESGDGRLRSFEVFLEPQEVGDGGPGFFVAAVDVTRRARAQEGLHQRTRAIEELHRIGSHPSLTLDEKIDALLTLGCEQFALDLGVFARVQRGEWVVRRLRPTSAPIEPGDAFPLEGSLCGQAIEAAGPVTYDASRDGGAETYPAYPGELLGRYLGVPVMVGAETFGMLSFSSLEATGRAFESFLVNLIDLMGQWLGGELERRAVLEGQELLAEAGRVLAGSLDEAEILDRGVQLALPMLGDGCVVYSLRPDGPVRVMASHLDPELVELLEAPSEASNDQDRVPPPVLAVLRTGEASVEECIVEATGRPGLADAAWEGLPAEACGSLLVAPLRARREVVGAMAFFSADAHRYTEYHLSVARELASLCGSALESARLLERARSAVEARDEVLSLVSHDLGSPLSSVSMSVEHLRRLAEKGEEPKRLLEYLDGMKDATDRMERLVEDLLAVEVLERGGVGARDAALEASAVLQAAVRELRPRFEAGSIELEITTGTDATVSAERDGVLRVLVNLLDNAAKFTQPGGRVEVGADRPGDGSIHFFVSDTGKGISRGQLERIFDRYVQAHEERRAGAGLGLAIVKKTVASYGGRVWVESEEGVGSTFHFTLPEG